MVGRPSRDWLSVLSEGDQALLAGDVDSAARAYHQLFSELTTAVLPMTSRDFLLTAVVAHRLAVTEYLTGDPDAAILKFADVDRLLDSAGASVIDEDARGYIEAVRDQSQEHRHRLRFASEPLKAVEMVAICHHGCPSITTDCGYDSPHC